MLIGIGSLVVSKCGRDKDKYFLVTKIENNYVYLCDGDIRKIDNPKRKKEKHIMPTKYFLNDISNKIHNNIKITNKEINRAIEDTVCKEGK